MIYRTIENTNYAVSDEGKVINIKTNRILKPHYNKKGYAQVVLSDGKGNTTCKYVHKLVAEYFVDNPNNYYEVTHIDYDNTNNKADNLQWTNTKHKMSSDRATINKAIRKGIDYMLGDYNISDNDINLFIQYVTNIMHK